MLLFLILCRYAYELCSMVLSICCVLVFFFFFKQKTAYEMRISDWSSDVCSSDLEVQSELRSLAEALRGDAGAIQVLGFAGPQADVGAGGEANGQKAVEDQAPKLALSRERKVRSLLIDDGIPPTSLRVRSLVDRGEGGPATRVAKIGRAQRCTQDN